MQYHYAYAFDMFGEDDEDYQDDILSSLTIERLVELKNELDSYRTRITKDQFAMANDIFSYDPEASIRYCKLVKVSKLTKPFRRKNG